MRLNVNSGEKSNEFVGDDNAGWETGFYTSANICRHATTVQNFRLS
jgi:hypothetical protein